MSKKPRDNRPYLPPVKRIELSESNIRLRWILIVVLLAIGVVAIGYGLHAAMNTQPGWNEVSAISDQPNCGSEFKLMYDFSESGGNATAVSKRLTEVYSRACEEAFLIFSPDVESEDNLYWLNHHVNEPVIVNATLYSALELLNRQDNRCGFLAPVYVEYNRVFLSESDGEAALYDPLKNPEIGAYVQELMTYLSDPEHIRLELHGENQVTLMVSEDYLAFAEEYGIESFLDFGWMKNAFIADFLAETLEAEGFTYGYLSSFDGFTRNLDNRGHSFSFNVFDRQGNTLYLPAEFTYTGKQSIVFLRDYPMTELDQWRYYAYEDGQISSVLLSPETGTPAASATTLISMSEKMSCAQMLMEMVPVFLTEEFSADAANGMKEGGLSSVWCKNGVVYYNDASIAPTLLDTGVQAGYTVSFAG